MANITFTGYLGADPELRASPSGIDVVKFRVGETFRRDGKKATQWHNCVSFGSFGTKVVHALGRVGSHVYVVGSLEEREWKDADGRTQKNREVVCSHFEILNAPPAREEAELTEEEADLNPPA